MISEVIKLVEQSKNKTNEKLVRIGLSERDYKRFKYEYDLSINHLGVVPDGPMLIDGVEIGCDPISSEEVNLYVQPKNQFSVRLKWEDAIEI